MSSFKQTVADKINEETSTLLSFDIINLDEEIQSELRESIEKEGKIVYEEV